MDITTDSNFKGASLTKALFIYRDTNVAPPAIIACAYDADSSGALVDGRFLSGKEVVALGRAVHGSLSSKLPSSDRNLIPDPEIVAYSDGFLVFEIPAHSRRLFLDEAFGDVRKESIPLPRILVVLNGSDTFMFAVKSRGRITSGTKLYVSPIPGNDHSGLVHSCGIRFPSNRHSPRSWRATADALLDAQKSFHFAARITKNPFVEVALKAVESQTFPSGELIPLGRTLGDFVAGLH